MLSPDVPEFVPRRFQNPEATASLENESQAHANVGAALGLHAVSNHTSYPYSLPSDCSSSQVLSNETGKWRNVSFPSSPREEETAVTNTFRSHQNAHKPNYSSHSDGNWRNDKWNSKQNSRIESRNKLSGRSASHEVSPKSNDNWRENNSQAQTIGNRQGSQRNIRAPFVKRNVSSSNDSAAQITGQGLRNYPSTKKWESKPSMEMAQHRPTGNQSRKGSVLINSEKHASDHINRGVHEESKQAHMQRKVEPQLKVDDEIFNMPRISQGAKVEKSDSSLQARHHTGNVSYKKILSRKNDGEIVIEKSEPAVNLIPSQSEEQWPSLLVTSPQNSAAKSGDNVWMKNNNPVSVSWASPSNETNPALHSMEVKVPDWKKSSNIENQRSKIGRNKQLESRHIVKEKRIVEREGYQLKDTYQKKERVWQAEYQRPSRAIFDKDGKENSNGHVKDNLHKSKMLKKYKILDNKMTGKIGENNNDNAKEELRNHDKPVTSDISSKVYSQPSSVNREETTDIKNSKFGAEEGVSLKEDEASQWQVKKKKKMKVKEQQEGGVGHVIEESNSSLNSREKGLEKIERLQTRYSKASKHSDSKRANVGCEISKQSPSKYPKDNDDSKSKEASMSSRKERIWPSKHSKDEKYTDGQEAFARSKRENQRRGDGKDLSRTEKLEGANLKGHIKIDGRVEAEKQLSGAKSSKASELVSGNASKGASGTNKIHTSQKLSVSADKEKPSVEDEAARKANAEKKARRKEEKMRKRESKLKKAHAMMMADSKVTMVSKEVLEMMYRGSNQQQKKASRPLPRIKDPHRKPLCADDESLQFSIEEYPTLMKGDPKISMVAKHDVDSVLYNSDQEHYQSCSSSEEDSEVTVNEVQKIFTKNETESTSKKFGLQKDETFKFNKKEDHVSRSTGTSATTILEKDKDSSDVFASEAVPSYSRALLTASRSKVVRQKPVVHKQSVEMNAPKIAAPKKKVRTKDGITFDLLDAVTKKVKRKEKHAEFGNASSKLTKTEDELERDLVAAAARKKNRNKSRELLAALDPNLLKRAEKDTPSSREGEGDMSFIKSVKTKKSSKLRSEVVAKRGKQREGKKKKKLSSLKKAMKRARELEVENLLSVLQEAKKLHENPVPSSTPTSDVTCAVLDSVADVSSDFTSNVITNEPADAKQIDLPEESPENHEALKIRPIDKLKETRNIGITNADSESSENKCITDASEERNVNILLENVKKGEEETGILNLNATEGISNTVDQEFSKKCLKIVKELGVLQNSVHKRSFREYCNHMITPEVDLAAKELISTLVRFQERQFQRDPVKARIRRRFVCGLRSTTKTMGKMSCVIVAPDIDRCKGPGALDEVVEKMLDQAKTHGVPVIFTLSSKRIGRLCLKKVSVSCMGIINYHGAQDIFHRLMEMIPEAQKQYQELIAHGSRTLPVGDEPPDEEESMPGPESTKEVTASDGTLFTSTVEKGYSALVPQSTREEVIASTVAILNKKIEGVCQPVS